MANTRSQRLKSAKKAPSARTVPRSVTKQAARIIFPRLVRLRPVSTITAYTTATEVVESAMPQMSAPWYVQPVTQ